MPPGLASFHFFNVAARIANVMQVALALLAGTVAGLALWSLCQVGNQSFVLFQLVSRVAQSDLELMVVLLPFSLRMHAGMTHVSGHSWLYGSSSLCDGYTCNRKNPLGAEGVAR